VTALNIDRPVVLIVEENAEALTFLGDNLTADGLEVIASAAAGGGLRLAAEHRPDLALVAVNGGSGRDFAKVVRAGALTVEARLPMILLGGDSHEIDTLRALDSGADDYVAKSTPYPVLYARCRALLRRVELDRQPRDTTVTVGVLTLNARTRGCTVAGEPVALTPKEFLLLQTLMSDPHRVWTKQELTARMLIRSGSKRGGFRTLDSHVARLRTSLGAGYVQNARGVGYRLMTETGATA
jgi:two-component system phosphate regulon response regulator PhoB